MKFEDIIYEKQGPIARITINRPRKYNAFTEHTIEELTAAFQDVENDASIGVAVLTGAGDHFSTGGDVNMEHEYTAATGRRICKKTLLLSTVMRNNAKPIIARVKGYASGGGNEQQILCDVTIASEEARFGQAGPKIGNVPIWYATQMLQGLVGEKKAREICMFCYQYSATEACDMGMINKVVPADKLDAEVDAWCQRALQMSPNSLRVAKVSLNYASDLLYGGVAHGIEMLYGLHGSDEFKEGTKAFLEKRKPDWSRFRK
jgi:dihydroxynaphthoic acid synthetase